MGGRQLRAQEQQCRSAGCFKLARWKCMIVMPKPPLAIPTVIEDGDRARLFSGVCVCDRHRAEATTIQVLGPIGYPALCAAFKAMKKKPPAIGDISVDFESLEHSPVLIQA